MIMYIINRILHTYLFIYVDVCILLYNIMPVINKYINNKLYFSC